MVTHPLPCKCNDIHMVCMWSYLLAQVISYNLYRWREPGRRWGVTYSPARLDCGCDLMCMKPHLRCGPCVCDHVSCRPSPVAFWGVVWCEPLPLGMGGALDLPKVIMFGLACVVGRVPPKINRVYLWISIGIEDTQILLSMIIV